MAQYPLPPLYGRLVFLTTVNLPARELVSGVDFIIGRGPECNLVLRRRAISMSSFAPYSVLPDRPGPGLEHCVIRRRTREGGSSEAYIQDMKSRYGTYVSTHLRAPRAKCGADHNGHLQVNGSKLGVGENLLKDSDYITLGGPRVATLGGLVLT